MTAALDYAAEDAATLRTFDADCDARQERAEERWHLAESIRIERTEREVDHDTDEQALGIVEVVRRLRAEGREDLALGIYEHTRTQAQAGAPIHRAALPDLRRLYREVA